MACVVCGGQDHEATWESTWATCPKGVEPKQNTIGWTCPACHKGNAPDQKGCVHCAGPQEPLDATSGTHSITSNVVDPRYRIISTRRAGDMLHKGGR